MGARGPMPTPTKILKMRGSWRAAGREGEVEYAAGMPECPPGLSEVAQAEFKRLAEHLLDVGLLCLTDVGILASYCAAYAEWLELEAAIAAIKAEAESVQEAYVVIGRGRLPFHRNMAVDRMTKAAAHFGFSPASRARVKGGQVGGKEADALEAALGG